MDSGATGFGATLSRAAQGKATATTHSRAALAKPRSPTLQPSAKPRPPTLGPQPSAAAPNQSVVSGLEERARIRNRLLIAVGDCMQTSKRLREVANYAEDSGDFKSLKRQMLVASQNLDKRLDTMATEIANNF